MFVNIVAGIILLIFINLWRKNNSPKYLNAPSMPTQGVWCIVKKTNPYDFEGNKVFKSELQAEEYRLHMFLTGCDEYESQTVELALDLIKSYYFEKGFDEASSKVKVDSVNQTLDKMLKD